MRPMTPAKEETSGAQALPGHRSLFVLFACRPYSD